MFWRVVRVIRVHSAPRAACAFVIHNQTSTYCVWGQCRGAQVLRLYYCAHPVACSSCSTPAREEISDARSRCSGVTSQAGKGSTCPVIRLVQRMESVTHQIAVLHRRGGYRRGAAKLHLPLHALLYALQLVPMVVCLEGYE